MRTAFLVPSQLLPTPHTMFEISHPPFPKMLVGVNLRPEPLKQRLLSLLGLWFFFSPSFPGYVSTEWQKNKPFLLSAVKRNDKEWHQEGRFPGVSRHVKANHRRYTGLVSSASATAPVTRGGGLYQMKRWQHPTRDTSPELPVTSAAVRKNAEGCYFSLSCPVFCSWISLHQAPTTAASLLLRLHVLVLRLLGPHLPLWANIFWEPWSLSLHWSGNAIHSGLWSRSQMHPHLLAECFLRIW